MLKSDMKSCTSVTDILRKFLNTLRASLQYIRTSISA